MQATIARARPPGTAPAMALPRAGAAQCPAAHAAPPTGAAARLRAASIGAPHHHPPNRSSAFVPLPMRTARGARRLGGRSLAGIVLAQGGAGAAAGGGSEDTGEDPIQEAIAKAEAAIQEAEGQLDQIPTLPSAHPFWLQSGGKALKVILSLSSFLGVLWASQHAPILVRASSSFALMAAVVLGALRRRSLSMDGAVAATAVGWITLFTGFRQGLVLLGFFVVSSALTKFKSMDKEGLEEDFKEGGQRNWVQVLCNGGVPTVLAACAGVLGGFVDGALGAPGGSKALTAALGGFLGYYGCCAGDTWASEVGVLSSEQPRLITTFRPVRPGTNGGVTWLGLGASAAGGTFVGLIFYLGTLASRVAWPLAKGAVSVATAGGGAGAAPAAAWAAGQWKAVVVGLLAGIAGSLIDSVLGATVQFTGYDVNKQKVVGTPKQGVQHISGYPFLSNNMVNLVSATSTAALAAFAAINLFA